jgi:hypothetical protein
MHSPFSIHALLLQRRGLGGIALLRAMYRDGFTYAQAIRGARELQNWTEADRQQTAAALGC